MADLNPLIHFSDCNRYESPAARNRSAVDRYPEIGTRDSISGFDIRVRYPGSISEDQFDFGGNVVILSRMWMLSSMVLPTISRLFGLSLSTVSCGVCQKTLLYP